MINFLKSIKSYQKNILKSTADKFNQIHNHQLFYISEKGKWVVYQEGVYLSKYLRSDKLMKVIIRFSDKDIKGGIVHYGSKHLLFEDNKFINPYKGNKNIMTCFHIEPGDRILNYNLINLSHYFEFIHTSCIKTKEELIKLGVPHDKVVVIPLGVDTNLFKPASNDEYLKIRTKLEIPPGSICIGSFQKDGAGWGEGLMPKMIKGPDILCEVLKSLSQKYHIFVLLTGPARGYVKKRLDGLNISYKHVFEKNYNNISKFYKALDLYLVTSRIEGGPKAIVEAMASGIPLITTNVGMASDIIEEGRNGFICKNTNSDKDLIYKMIEKSDYVIKNVDKEKYKITSSVMAKKYDWSNISKLYFENMYSKLF